MLHVSVDNKIRKYYNITNVLQINVAINYFCNTFNYINAKKNSVA